MKKTYLRLILLFFLVACWPVWADKSPSIEIKVEGLPDTIKTKIVSMLAGRSQNIPTPLTIEAVQSFYQQSPNNIRTSLQAYGYFKPQILSSLKKVKNNWIITYTIRPGPSIKVIHVDAKVQGEGTQDSEFKKLLKDLPVKVGQILDVDKYQQTKDALFNLASTRGYFDAKMLVNQIIININYRQASIVLHFDTGKRYRFGPTYFPPTDLNEDLLERFLRYNAGELYNSTLLQKTQQVLAGSGFFSQSVVTPMTTDVEDMQVPIKVELTPVRPRRYTFGLGYGTDTGPRGTLGFNWIPINSYGHHLNFMARGSYLDVGGQTQQNSYANLSYIIPGKDPATDSYAFTIGYGIIKQTTGSAESFKAAASYNTVLGDDWQEILALNFINERYNFIDTLKTNANLLYPSGHWQYLHNRAIIKDKIITQGVSAAFDLAGAPFQLGSSSGFLQAKASLKALATLDITQTRFLFRTQLGHTQIDTLMKLPLTLQLFAGGPNSIRGFKYNTIGPGRELFVVSGEIQQKIYGNFYLAGFVDSGVVSDRKNDLDSSAQHHVNYYNVGAGAGVVYLTQIGAVELALARPVINGGKTWQLEFSVGAEL